MTITIKRITAEEGGEVAYKLATYAFMHTPPLPNKEEFTKRGSARRGVDYFAAYEDSQPVAMAGHHDMTQNVRGKIYPTSGLFMVATDPSARRKGLARKVIQKLLSDMRDEGFMFSALYPFRESFYERLGYVPYPRPRFVHFTPSAVEPLLKKDLGGQVECCLNSENGKWEEYFDFCHKLQSGLHGMTVFDNTTPIFKEINERWLALAKVDGETVGAMVYSFEGEIITQFILRAWNFYYTTPQGLYLLLEWIARHLNQASQVELWLAPDDYPDTWYTDFDYTNGSMTKPPMGRVLDVARIGGMQVGPGKFTAQIVDPYCPWNEGTWIFESCGELAVKPGSQPDCKLTIQGLSALVYGVNDPAELAYRGWGELPAQIQSVMRSMFPRKVPYIHERF